MEKLKTDFFKDAQKAYGMIRDFTPTSQITKKGDTPVTQLDLNISSMFKALAQTHDIRLFDEESHRGSLQNGITLVIDPLDGTRDTLTGLESVGLSLAILKNGVPIATYSAMPHLGEVIIYDGTHTKHTMHAGTDKETIRGIYKRDDPLNPQNGAYLFVDPPLCGIAGQHKDKKNTPVINIRSEWSSVATCMRLATRQSGSDLTVNEGIAGYLFKSMPHDIASTFPAIWAAGLKIYDLCDGSEVTALNDNMFNAKNDHRLKSVWLICHPQDYNWLSKFSVKNVIPHQFEGSVRDTFVKQGLGGMLVSENQQGMTLSK